MDAEFAEAALAIAAGDHGELARLLRADATLAAKRSSCGHPTLLQLVACETEHLPDPAGSAMVLIEAGAPVDEPLVAAAGCGAWPIAERLLDAGAVIDGVAEWTPLDEALYWSNLDIAARLVDRGAGIRRLRVTAALGDTAGIAGWFPQENLRGDAGPIASPFPDTVTPASEGDPAHIIDHAFVMAVNNGFRDAAAALVERGARVNATPPGFHWKGAALHAAAWRGDRDLVEWLLAIGADPTVRDGMVNADAAGWAAHHGHDALADRLRSA